MKNYQKMANLVDSYGVFVTPLNCLIRGNFTFSTNSVIR